MEQFVDQKLLETLPDTNMPEEEKIRKLTDAFAKLTKMSIRAMAQTVAMIEVDNEVVVETEYIEEFIKQCDRNVFEQIRLHITNLRKATELKPLKIACQSCSKEYDTPFTLDVSNFFGSAS